MVPSYIHRAFLLLMVCRTSDLHAGRLHDRKRRERRRQLTATTKKLSAGFAEITETMEMTKTTGIRGANATSSQTTGLEIPEFRGPVLSKKTMEACKPACLESICLPIHTNGCRAGVRGCKHVRAARADGFFASQELCKVTGWIRKLEKAVAVRNSLLELCSGKFRRCWKVLPRFSGSTTFHSCPGLATFRQGRGLLEDRPHLWELSWISPPRPPQPS